MTDAEKHASDALDALRQAEMLSKRIGRPHMTERENSNHQLDMSRAVAAAQVHATLALAAATERGQNR